MKLPWSGSDKRKTSQSGGMVTSVGVAVGNTTALVPTNSSGPSRRPGRPNLTVERMDEQDAEPPSGRFKLDR